MRVFIKKYYLWLYLWRDSIRRIEPKLGLDIDPQSNRIKQNQTQQQEAREDMMMRVCSLTQIAKACLFRRCNPHQRRYNFVRLLSTGDAVSSNKTSAATKTDELTADGKTSTDYNNIAAKLIQPRPLFPWRSSPHPLPRLVLPPRNNTTDGGDADKSSQQSISDEEYYNSDYFTKGGPLGPGWFSPMESWFRGVLYANSMHLLNVSWFSILVPWSRKEWEEEMEWCFCQAFLRGVNGMIHDTYMLDDNNPNDPNENMQSSDLVLDFDHTLRKHKGANEGNKRKVLDQDDERCMLQYKLRQLYQSAREHSMPSDVNIVLKTEPVSATIESMFPIFGLSRSLVQE